MLVAVTFPMIWVGGLVTTYDAGMAVPDWPTTYGYNLLLYPWSTWIAGPWDLFIEHGHRLLGTLVGLLTIALVVAVWRWDARRWVRWLAALSLAAVVLQGSLGGLRVIADDVDIAMLHGCFGPAFFVLTALLATVVSPAWTAPGLPRVVEGAGALGRLALTTSLLAYVQLCIGAQLRHMPAWISPMQFRVVLVAHVALAVGILLAVLVTGYRALRLRRHGFALAAPAILLAEVVAQVGLGAATFVARYGWPSLLESQGWEASYVVAAEGRPQAWITTAHVALGSLVVATAAVIALRTMRFYSDPQSAGEADRFRVAHAPMPALVPSEVGR